MTSEAPIPPRIPPPVPAARWWRSTSFRLALGIAASFALAALVLIGLLWWATVSALVRPVETPVRAELAALRQIFHQQGRAGVIAAIAAQRGTDEGNGTVVLLADPRLTPLAGTLPLWPPGLRPAAIGWHELAVARSPGAAAEPVRLYHARLPGGLHLLVGRDLGQAASLRPAVVEAVTWSAGVALGLAALLGWGLRSLFLAHLHAIRAGAEAIAQGDIRHRLPRSGDGDEFDQLAATINQLFERIEQLIDDARTASAAIAHDLRTPLTELRGRLEELQGRHQAQPALAGELEQALAEVDRLNQMFSALLRLAEIESGHRRAGFGPVDLSAVAADVGELYAAVAESRGIVLVPTITPGLMVLGDRHLLGQAVANLLDNALKFAPGGTTVELQMVPEGERAATLVVSDRGPGIPPADRPLVTRRFFRGDRSRHQPGLGLGLSLVQAIAALHQATLDFSDQQPGLRVQLRVARMPSGAKLG